MCVTDAMTRLPAGKRAGVSVISGRDLRRAAAGFRVVSPRGGHSGRSFFRRRPLADLHAGNQRVLAVSVGLENRCLSFLDLERALTI
jgi:hypothetical protein